MTNLLPTSPTESSATPVTGRHLRRFFGDALAGLGLFALGTVMTSGSGALAATLENTPELLLQPSAAHPVVLLATVFSVLFALNAAFFRHLARAYSQASRKH